MDLSGFELATIYETVRRVQDSIRSPPANVKDIFSSQARLIITPNTNCHGRCLHCVADSHPNGITLPYSDFTGINPEFFSIFSAADFGRKGNPLEYESEGKDLSDLVSFLASIGIKQFTLALALQKHPNSVTQRLEDLARSQEIRIETMVTYHHYFENLNPAELAGDFNLTLRNYSGFSDKLVVSLLGEKFTSAAKDVKASFESGKDIILSGIDPKRLEIRPLDTKVHPLGRFRKYLQSRGILEEYEKQFAEAMGDYACPDLIKWPGIIIEPNGDINTCASFEAINCNDAVVSNIIAKPYQEVKRDLLALYRKEKEWFVEHIEDILKSRVPMCKLKSKCYREI